jgi:hypothetical protein
VLYREEHGEDDGCGDDGVPLWDLVSRVHFNESMTFGWAWAHCTDAS